MAQQLAVGDHSSDASALDALNAATTPVTVVCNQDYLASGTQRLLDCRSNRSPLVLRGFARSWKCCGWSVESLVAKAGTAPVRCFVSSKGTFFLDGTWHPQSVLTCSMAFEATVAEVLQPPPPDAPGHWPSCYALDEHFFEGDEPTHPLAFDVPHSPAAELGPVHQRQLFLAYGPTTTQVHRDPFDNVYVCCLGRRRWRFAHAAHAWLAPTEEPDAVSAACQPHLDAWGPKPEDNQRVRFAEVELEAGDALFMPSRWWHQVSSTSPASAAVNYYFASAAGTSHYTSSPS